MTSERFGYLTPQTLGLFTDRYELTMMRGYGENDHTPEATFSLYYRSLPTNRGYVIAAGLEQVLAYLDSIEFGERALPHLRAEGFPEGFLDVLADFEFTGDVRAVPEGTAVFPNEPLLEVTAPIEQAQLFETLVLNQVGFQSLIATKAARMRDTVDRHDEDVTLVDFGSRRAHGTDAGVKAARAAFVGGFDGTSNEAAAEAFDLPAYGTMAHSWVQSFETERAAFEAFVDVYGEDAVLLIDTYDTVAGAETALDVARERDVDVRGVRLDSGDLPALSVAVREILPAEMDVFVSSGVDEFFLREFYERDGVADGFGPGTSLTTSKDAPTLNPVYKLVAVEQDGEMTPSTKLSAGKVSYPCAKSVHRFEDEDGLARDVVARRDEDVGGRELLVDVVQDGEVVYDSPDLAAIRDRTARTLAKVPAGVRAIEDPEEYPVAISDGLAATTDRLEADLRKEAGLE
ncbi:nicotinate phosphoribosyltransferase [Salinarchaeum sp. Harcht-Bsk1]|uniref:nicotinate phosphoribosyltransferase n=1 Tax=Salinarchaeum sp. Harcht-Bsk1 TaxID=1333523 RepID=UPI0003424693|nr:nicotinate phosphoribosyltransferase [Salinarchaeum sp. Harcht-Bsk1]AGN01024.1 nicotinate phosphoribosyltransferase [Salinarchaeum sp. Harcht-Bsk1]